MRNMFFFLAVFAQLLAAISQILLKKSASKEHASFAREYLKVLVIGGYAILVVSMAIMIFCYKGLGYMAAVVMEPVSYIMVMLLSRVFFGEKVTLYKILGVCLIICGIAVFYRA
ncbi:MAG: EamA family transporter [Lachnospiraceae bacterium]|nr:EamA family transporter [Lachnospiraceae bacterium]